MAVFTPYGHAIVALAALAAFGLVMSLATGMSKVRLGLPPGSEPPADYANPAYRWHRAYLNLAETMGYFAAVAVAAMLAGAPAFWVNMLAALFVLSRVLLAVVHVGGVGRPDMSLRSYLYLVGWALCLGLAGLAIAEVLA